MAEGRNLRLLQRTEYNAWCHFVGNATLVAMRLLLLRYAAALIAVLLPAMASADESAIRPHWIWSQDTGQFDSQPTPTEKCRFERRFTLDAPPRSASLRFAADFCF